MVDEAQATAAPPTIEQTQQSSDEQFRFIAEHIPGVVYSFDSHPDYPRRSVFVGPGLGTLIGSSAAADVRKSIGLFFDLIHPEDRAALEQVGDLDKASNRPIDQQYRLRTESGDYMWVRSVGQAIQIADGWTRWHGVLIDISEQKRTEQALRESEERLRQIVENADEVFFLSDASNDSIIYVSPAYEKIWGRPVQELYENAQAWQRAVHPDDAQRIDAVMKEHERGRTAFTHEYRIIQPDGTIRWVRDRVFPIRDASGEIVRIAGITDDVTDRRVAEEALQHAHDQLEHRVNERTAELLAANERTTKELNQRQEVDRALRHSEEQYRTLVEQATDGIFIVDTQGRFVEANSAGCKMLAYSPDELRQFAIDDLLAEDDPKKKKPRLNELRDGKSIVSERRYRRGDGEIIYMEIHAGMLPDGRILGIARDVTQRKKQEQELRDRSELERLLFGELDHRTRNNLASLITLIDVTSRSGEDVAEFAKSMKHRIMGMANVHSLLSQSHWRPITLRDLIAVLTTAKYPGTIAIDGTGVLISPRQTTGLGVVINELMINSLKHGALQSPQGLVEISWEFHRPKATPQRLVLKWHESNGPAVAPQPKPSVGSRIIEGIMRSELGGEAQMSYPPAGAQHRFVIALDTVEEMHAAEATSGSTPLERS